MLRQLFSIVFIFSLVFVVSGCKKMGPEQNEVKAQFEKITTLIKADEGRSAILELVDWDATFAQNAQSYQRGGLNSADDLRKSREEFFNNPGLAMLNNVKRAHERMGKPVPQLANIPEGEIAAKEQKMVDINNIIFQARLDREKKKTFEIENIVVTGNTATANVNVVDPASPNPEMKKKSETVTFNKKGSNWLLADTIRSSFGILR